MTIQLNICITGGAGYIGSVLTARLLRLGHKVTVVDTFLHGYHGVLRYAPHPLLAVVNRDIRHEDRDYLEKQDVVFHLAAISSIQKCEDDKDWTRSVNRDAVAEIAKNLHHDTMLVFASSTAVYGDQKGRTVTEDPVVMPRHSVYSDTKIVAERLIERRYNTIILRLATIYGVSPLMRPNSIVNDFVRMAVQDKYIMLYEAGNVRPYMHIKDCVDGLIFTMEHAEEMNLQCYNLGQDNFTKHGIAGKIHGQTDCEIHVTSKKSLHPQNFIADFTKIKALGFECKRSLFAGIIELIRLYSFYRP